jgi:hypothetical protein
MRQVTKGEIGKEREQEASVATGAEIGVLGARKWARWILSNAKRAEKLLND